MQKTDQQRRQELVDRATAKFGRPFIVFYETEIDVCELPICTPEDARQFVIHRTGSDWRARDMGRWTA